MKAEIISIGTELLTGKVVNSNAAFISNELTSLGIDVCSQVTVGSYTQDIIASLKKSEERGELIILIGGLGPSEDDITKQTLSSYLETDLILHKETEERIITYHKNSELKMPENNQLQALILAGSTPLKNDTGIAVGMILTKGSHQYVLLPGPADEFRPMVKNYLKEELIKRFIDTQVFESRKLRFFGITEAELVERIGEDINKYEQVVVTINSCEEEVTVKINVRADTRKEAENYIDEIQMKVLNKLNSYFFGYGEKKLTDVVKDLLLERSLTITAAESLTGGAFMSAITSGESAGSIFEGGVVAYSEDKKHQVLNINQETIDEFGVVSKQCAVEMAENARRIFDADIGIGLTGVAGPGSLEGQIPGTVFIGLSYKGEDTNVQRFHFDYRRNKNRKLAVLNALDMVRHFILNLPTKNDAKCDKNL
ncbi:competence/damage-inducible protein A [Alkalibacterium kapii]|uniref:Putative competence-damage inducible protein n=1 Tax=Alkalibacterium kapii TaxID=426704 RepID=A0A511ATF3_9LACT|nr:competence/damage-inducible protein A [Alkalibacterium kapii]GEK91475.1 putative competence-damage inducible protein [Alkalibacterium kapii]